MSWSGNPSERSHFMSGKQMHFFLVYSARYIQVCCCRHVQKVSKYQKTESYISTLQKKKNGCYGLGQKRHRQEVTEPPRKKHGTQSCKQTVLKHGIFLIPNVPSSVESGTLGWSFTSSRDKGCLPPSSSIDQSKEMKAGKEGRSNSSTSGGWEVCIVVFPMELISLFYSMIL